MKNVGMVSLLVQQVHMIGYRLKSKFHHCFQSYLLIEYIYIPIQKKVRLASV